MTASRSEGDSGSAAPLEASPSPAPAAPGALPWPSAPWTLSGRCTGLIGLAPIDGVRALVPAPLAVLPLLPRLTLAGVVLAHYTASPVGPYRELLVLTLARAESGPGLLVARIAVDDEASLQAGRAIWKLPKEPARFQWDRLGRAARVSVEGPDYQLGLDARPFGLPVPFALDLPFLATGGRAPVRFRARLAGRACLALVRLRLRTGGPLRALRLSSSLGFAIERLDLLVRPPVLAGSGRPDPRPRP